MRAKTALLMATVGLFMTAGWTADCLAGSGLAGTPKDETVAVIGTPRNEPVADVASQSTDQADAQVDAAGVDNGGNARLEEAGPAPTEKRPGQHSSSHVGIGLKISTLGAGIEAALPLAERANLRAGANFFQYNRAITKDGIHYSGQLQFRSAEAHLDWFLFSGFHISPGVLFYNGNQLTANASVPGGQNFTLNGTAYQSSMTSPVTGTGKLDFVKVSPSIMLGFGSLIPRSGRHYSFLFEFGGAYQGSARVALNLTGSVCDSSGANCVPTSNSTVQANVLAEQQKIKKDINPYRFFPVVSIGVGFNF